MPDLTKLRATVNAILTEENQLFRTLVPSADQLSVVCEQPLNPAYYLRHRIETVHRIRATAKIDAMALAYMVDEDYDAARMWAHYTEQEMNHDKLFLQDLSRHQISAEQVLATPMFRATVELMQYLTTRIQVFGSLPAVAYPVFVEWNGERSSPGAVERAQAAFSAEHVKGARAHIGFDDKHGHVDTILEIADRLTSRRGTADLLFIMLREISALFRAYFTELHWWAVAHPMPLPGNGTAATTVPPNGDRTS